MGEILSTFDLMPTISRLLVTGCKHSYPAADIQQLSIDRLCALAAANCVCLVRRDDEILSLHQQIGSNAELEAEKQELLGQLVMTTRSRDELSWNVKVREAQLLHLAEMLCGYIMHMLHTYERI